MTVLLEMLFNPNSPLEYLTVVLEYFNFCAKK